MAQCHEKALARVDSSQGQAWRVLAHMQKIDCYPARMIARLPWEIMIGAKPDSSFLDPFCGSGGPLGAACALGFRATGIDLNPLAPLLSHLKFGAYNLHKLRDVLSDAVREASEDCRPGLIWVPLPIDISYWFGESTLAFLRRCVGFVKARQSETPAAADAALGVISCVVRRCSRADHRGPKPFISKAARRMPIPTPDDARELILRKLDQVEQYVGQWRSIFPHASIPRLLVGDAREPLPRCGLVLTSPPYLCAQDYYRSTKLELAVTGLFPPSGPTAFSRSLIGSDRGPARYEDSAEPLALLGSRSVLSKTVSALRAKSDSHAALAVRYFTGMLSALRSIQRAIKPGGTAVIVIGNSCVRGVPVPTADITVALGEAVGLRLTSRRSDEIRNRWVPPQRWKHSSVIDREHVLTFVRQQHR